MSAIGPRFRLRVQRPSLDPELRCPKCHEWLPLDSEFWHLNQWSECRACHAERQRLDQFLRYHADPEYRARELTRSRRYRAFIRRTAPEFLRTYDRERKAAKAAWLREFRARQRAAA